MITDKERDVQYALGLVSWYHVRDGKHGYSIKAVSKEDALHQFIMAETGANTEVAIAAIILQKGIGDFKIRKSFRSVK